MKVARRIASIFLITEEDLFTSETEEAPEGCEVGDVIGPFTPIGYLKGLLKAELMDKDQLIKAAEHLRKNVDQALREIAYENAQVLYVEITSKLDDLSDKSTNPEIKRSVTNIKARLKSINEGLILE